VAYEDLYRNVETTRASLYRFLGVDPRSAAALTQWTTPGFCQENMQSHYRKGVVGEWRHYFTNETRQWFYEEAGELLAELGYEW